MKKIYWNFLFCAAAVVLAAVAGCSEQKAGKTKIVFHGPADMKMSINGRKLDGVVRRVPAGEYIFKFESPGYYPVWKRVKVAENQKDFRVDVNMEKYTSAVYLTSSAEGIENDAGATIEHNGKPVGTTPGIITNLPLGKHSFKLSLRGHADHTVNVELADPRPQRINTVMVSTSGMLIVRGKPEKASLYLDGKFVGNLPWSGKTEAGKIKVELRAEGYMPGSEEFVLDNGKTLKVNMELVPAPGSISVKSNPANAAVFVKGEKIGTTPCKIENLKPGNYRVTLKHDGFDNWERLVELKAGSNEVIDADMTSEFGSARIIVRPAGIYVYIDGKSVGRVKTKSGAGNGLDTEPIQLDGLSPGRHKLLLTHPLANPERTEIVFEVIKGRTTTLPFRNIWVANCELINHSGEKERGMLYYENEDSLMFSPAPGIRKLIRKSDIRSKEEIKD